MALHLPILVEVLAPAKPARAKRSPAPLLEWHCAACNHDAPADDDRYPGDAESCVHCEGGTAVVRKSQSTRSRRLRWRDVRGDKSLVLHLSKHNQDRVTEREAEYLAALSESPLAEPLGPGYPERPKTRAECRGGQRPCPFISCAHHLYLDVMPGGNIRLNHPDKDVADMAESCALDVADRGGATLDEVAEHMNLTREGARQVERTAHRHVERQRKNGSRLLRGLDQGFEHAPGFTKPSGPED